LLGQRERHAGTIEQDRADLVHGTGIDLAQLACGRDGGIAIGAVDDVESQQLLLGFGEGTVGHQTVARTAQHAGFFRRPQPRRRADLFILVDPLVDPFQIEHQGGILLRRPGSDFVFDVVGQDRVEHGLCLSG
jgi:hypothetical protein